jgi:ribosomal protein S21
MAEFKRKKGESFESFLRRFNKKLQQSGKLYEARQRQHIKPERSRNQRKKQALSKIKIGEHKEYLKKIGKFKDE